MLILNIARIILLIGIILDIFTNWTSLIYFFVWLGVCIYLSPLFVFYEKWVCKFIEGYFKK